MERPPPKTPKAWGFTSPSWPPRGSQEEVTTLWVGSLPEMVTALDLEAAFGQAGTIVGSSVNTKASQGSYTAFVRFATRAEASEALNWVRGGQIMVAGVPCVARWARQNSRISRTGAEASAASGQPSNTGSPAVGFGGGQRCRGGGQTVGERAVSVRRRPKSERRERPLGGRLSLWVLRKIGTVRSWRRGLGPQRALRRAWMCGVPRRWGTRADGRGLHPGLCLAAGPWLRGGCAPPGDSANGQHRHSHS